MYDETVSVLLPSDVAHFLVPLTISGLHTTSNGQPRHAAPLVLAALHLDAQPVYVYPGVERTHPTLSPVALLCATCAPSQ